MLEKFVAPLILVLEDVHETRDGIEKLLTADGYRVAPARDELDTIESAQHTQPDLILVSLTGLTGEVLTMVHRLRERMAVRDRIPVVVFYVEDIAEGQEVDVAGISAHLIAHDAIQRVIVERQHAAIGVMQHDDLLRAQEPLRDHE